MMKKIWKKFKKCCSIKCCSHLQKLACIGFCYKSKSWRKSWGYDTDTDTDKDLF